MGSYHLLLRSSYANEYPVLHSRRRPRGGPSGCPHPTTNSGHRRRGLSDGKQRVALHPIRPEPESLRALNTTRLKELSAQN